MPATASVTGDVECFPRASLAPIEQLSCKLRTAYSRCPYWELRRLTFRLDDNHVSLEGRVTSYYAKQLAQEVIRREAPQLRIHNEIVVGVYPKSSVSSND